MTVNHLNQSNTLATNAILEFQASFLSYASLEESLLAYVTDLSVRFKFDRVSAGILNNNSVKIVAVSGETSEKKLFELNRLLSTAADEAISQNATIKYPANEQDTPKVILAHAALTQFSGYEALTVPIRAQNHVIGAMLFERDRQVAISPEEISNCEQAIAFLGPMLDLKIAANASLSQTLERKLKRFWTTGNQVLKRNLLIASCLGLLGLMFFPVTHQVGAPARLEGLIERALVAPEDGFLTQSYVRPGDQVKANQILAELADDDLKLEQQKKQSELVQYENAYGSALALSDRVQMMINEAKMEEVKSQLSLINQKIKRTKISAPFDGVVIKGDLKQSLGAPVQKGDALITISPAGQFRLIVEVDERDIDTIAINQKGRVALVSIPDEKIDFTVKSITPIAETKEGRNFFEVEGLLEATSKYPSLQPGLEGVAKIKTVNAPLIWIWTHRMVDWIKLTLWSWGW